MIQSLILFMMFTAAHATGTGSSGGGNAIVCRNISGSVSTARLYDLFESEVMYGMVFPATAGTTSDEIHRAVANAPNPYLGQDRISGINGIVQKIKFLPSGVKIKPTEDFGQIAVVVPEGCDVEGVGYYDSSDKLFISYDVFQALDGLSRAALWAHEEMYKTARAFGYAKDSKQIRYAVGSLFSVTPPADFTAELLNKALGYWIPDSRTQQICPVLSGPVVVNFEPSGSSTYAPKVYYFENGIEKIIEGPVVSGSSQLTIPHYQCGDPNNQPYRQTQIYANAYEEEGEVPISISFGGQEYQGTSVSVEFIRPQVLAPMP